MKNKSCTSHPSFSPLQNRLLGALMIGFLSGSSAFAALSNPSGISYTGIILNADDTPLNAPNVTFTFEIYDASQACLLYTETRSIDMTGSGGTFSVDIADGGGNGAFQGSLGGISDLFNNKDEFTGLSCTNGRTVFEADNELEPRVLRISFDVNDGKGPQTVPSLKINPVPAAYQAYSLNGYGTESLIKVDPSVIPGIYHNNPLTQAQYEEFWKLILGTSTTYAKTTGGTSPASFGSQTANTFLAAPNGSAGNPAFRTIASQDLPSTIGTDNGSSLSLKTNSMNRVTVDATGKVGIANTSPAYALDVGGDINLTGAIRINGTALSTSATTDTTNATNITSGTLAVARGGTGASTLTTGSLLVGNGTSAVNLLAAGAAGQILYGTSGTTWASGTPDTAGLVDKASTQTISGAKTFSNALTMSNQNPLVFSDSVTSSVSVRAPLAVSASYTLTLPASQGAASTILTNDGAGNLSWAAPSGGTPADSLTLYQARVATSTNTALSGTFSVDGVALAVGDRVLVKNQTTASQNGVYIVAAGAWTRAADLNTWAKAVGYRARVSEGTMWQGMTFVSLAPVAGTLDTTTLEFSAEGYTDSNTVFGYSAFAANQSGYSNAAFGYLALGQNTNGYANVAVGSASLFRNSTGFYNIGIGTYALNSNTSGSSNIGIGYSALMNTNTGQSNTGVGYEALYSNQIGIGNVAIGDNALYTNRGRGESTAVGFNAMGKASDSTTSSTSYNTAVGAFALYGSNTASVNNGRKNTAFGHSALRDVTSGTDNVAIGFAAGMGLTSGSNTVAINTGVIANLSNATLIGNLNTTTVVLNGATYDATKAIVVGTGASNGNGASLTTGGTWTNASDRRIKKEICDLEYGMEQIMKLRPVHYKLIDSDVPQVGFIAQEVYEVIPEVVEKPAQENGRWTMSYGNLIAVTVKAMQEQQAVIEKQKSEIDVMKQYLCDKDPAAPFCQ